MQILYISKWIEAKPIATEFALIFGKILTHLDIVNIASISTVFFTEEVYKCASKFRFRVTFVQWK